VRRGRKVVFCEGDVMCEGNLIAKANLTKGLLDPLRRRLNYDESYDLASICWLRRIGENRKENIEYYRKGSNKIREGI
jgi:hypothetical protein